MNEEPQFKFEQAKRALGNLDKGYGYGKGCRIQIRTRVTLTEKENVDICSMTTFSLR
jgi:hypothetical protein